LSGSILTREANRRLPLPCSRSPSVQLLRRAFTGTLLAVGGFSKASGEAALAAHRTDLIVYGRPFIANPDLVERFRLDAPLNTPDVRTFYGGDDHGYTDYPTLAEQA
jgi:N-ethylmaleimide reductase